MPVPVPPSMRGLAALHALACEKSLEKAAARLGVTRSAVSHRIAGLESELGVALTRKSGRSAVLTEEGEALLAAMGDALERIEGAVEPFLRRRRELRLSTVATFASLWLIPRLPLFQARWPRIELSIATTRRAVDFAAEDWDCAIRHGLGAWPGVAATLLFKETLVPVATPDLAERIGELGAAAWRLARPIYARSRFLDWSAWQGRRGDVGATPDRGFIVETRAQALEAALAGAGVAMMDAAYLRPHVLGGRLRWLASEKLPLEAGYYFIHPPAPRNASAVQALRGWLVGEAEEEEALSP
jgi:DNA-binding transcriptional LysR family regulator